MSHSPRTIEILDRSFEGLYDVYNNFIRLLSRIYPSKDTLDSFAVVGTIETPFDAVFTKSNYWNRFIFHVLDNRVLSAQNRKVYIFAYSRQRGADILIQSYNKALHIVAYGIYRTEPIILPASIVYKYIKQYKHELEIWRVQANALNYIPKSPSMRVLVTHKELVDMYKNTTEPVEMRWMARSVLTHEIKELSMSVIKKHQVMKLPAAQLHFRDDAQYNMQYDIRNIFRTRMLPLRMLLSANTDFLTIYALDIVQVEFDKIVKQEYKNDTELITYSDAVYKLFALFGLPNMKFYITSDKNILFGVDNATNLLKLIYVKRSHIDNMDIITILSQVNSADLYNFVFNPDKLFSINDLFEQKGG